MKSLTLIVFEKRSREVGLVVPGCYRVGVTRNEVATNNQLLGVGIHILFRCPRVHGQINSFHVTLYSISLGRSNP